LALLARLLPVVLVTIAVAGCPKKKDDAPTGPVDPVTITTNLLPDAYVGTGYSYTLQASGGVPPYVWSIAADSASPVPPGLALAPTTGSINGLPSTNGSFSVGWVASVAVGTQGLRVFLIPVFPVVTLVIVTLTLPNGNLGKLFDQSFAI
jgi:hypothetical protein